MPLRKILLPALLCCAVSNASAQTFGLVVGIDHYPKAGKDLQDLQGAVNDAKLLAETLRKQGVNIQENRVLLNEQATAAHFKAVFNELLGAAVPGDQIILTFAGHGSQEQEFSPPYDEQEDHLDETFVFYDFDEANPHLGRISDDEMHDLLAQDKARALDILFVADACHAGGAMRGGKKLVFRGGGPLGGYKPKPPAHDWNAPQTDDSQPLSYVTYLLATAREKDSIPEIPYQGQQHGALSVAFAQALDGKADRNGDGSVSGREMDEYVAAAVPKLTAAVNFKQVPNMRPRGGPEPIPKRGQTAPAPDPLAAKRGLLQALDAYAGAGKADINLQEDAGMRGLGQRLHFRFAPKSPSPPYFLLFNLASTGELQFLYPLRSHQDPEKLAQLPYDLELEVVPPGGEDNMVALFCASPKPEAVALLDAHDGQTPPDPNELLGKLGTDCQIGRKTYTSGR